MSQDHKNPLLVALLVLSLLIVGGNAGGGVAALTMRGSSTGFDGLGEFFIGLMSGAIAGVALAAFFTRRLEPGPFRRVVIGSSALAFVLIGWGVVRMRTEMAKANAAAPPPTTAPTAVPR